MGEVIKYFSILSAVILIATSCNGGGNKSNLESELDDVAMNVVEEATGDASLADYIVISKRSRSLKLYDSYNRLISRFTVAVGSGEGDKQFVGDMCTPEGEFVIEQIQSSADWLYDCGDGNGPTEGYYGNWFLRLSSPYKGIGIHGTSDIASLGTNSTNGSIHLANSDLDSLYNMVNILGIFALYDAVCKRGAVVYRGELATQILLQGIRIVECANQLIYDMRLLVGEVNKLRNILEVGALLA